MAESTVQSQRTTSEPNLADALRWAARSRPTGILKLTGEDQVEEFLFVDGELYVSEQHRLRDQLRIAFDEMGRETLTASAVLLGVVRELAVDLGRQPRVATFRFRKVGPSSAWLGPLSTAQLLMEVAVLDRSELQLLSQIGGEEACYVTNDVHPCSLLLTGDDQLVLSRFGSITSVKQLCAEFGGDRPRWLRSIVRLAVADLLTTAIPKTPEPEPAAAFIQPRPAVAHPAARAIWREQFHLTGDPFSLTPDPSFLFLSDCHAEALAGLKLGIWERRGLMVMIGEVGTGKTTLIYSLLSNLDPEIETAYLSNTLLSFEEILHGALLDFGIECSSRRRLDLIETLNAFLRRSAEAGKTVVLVIDESQNLSDEVFEGLRLLLNFETYKSKLLQIILVGQPELATRLRGRGLRQVRDRIAVRCHLNPLNRRDAKKYIEHRLETVGGSPSLFTRPALGVLVRRSKGIPRRINILCHNAMLFAYGRDMTRINWSTARQAFKDMDGSSLRRS